MKVFIILFTLLIPSLISALSFETKDMGEYCMKIKGNPGQFLHFTYMVKGRNEENVQFKVSVVLCTINVIAIQRVNRTAISASERTYSD